MAPPLRLGPAAIRFTGRDEGDLGSEGERGPSGPGVVVLGRRRAVVDRPWTWLRQVHGRRVVVVNGDESAMTGGPVGAVAGSETDDDVSASATGVGEDRPGDAAGSEADAAVSGSTTTALCILTADCAPIALASPEGVIGAAHAGWRGLAEGVVAATVAAMRGLGATSVEAALGPCIHPGCYEFSPADLDLVAHRLGAHVRGVTTDGRPALDLPAAVRGELAAAGVTLAFDADACTACTVADDGRPAWFSHRARREDERQAVVVWLPR